MTLTHINGYLMNVIDRGKGTAPLFIHPPVLNVYPNFTLTFVPDQEAVTTHLIFY